MNNGISNKIKNEILKRDSFTCQKCGFVSKTSNELEIHHIKPVSFNGQNDFLNLISLCSICHKFAPASENEFKKYLSEKIDCNLLNTFRNKSISQLTSFGMEKKSQEGDITNRAPLGYIIKSKKLIINPSEKGKIQEIFNFFLNDEVSLNKLAKKYHYSARGIKKLLKNKTYLGMVRFKNEWHDGHQEPIVSLDTFEAVQNKLAIIERKKK